MVLLRVQNFCQKCNNVLTPIQYCFNDLFFCFSLSEKSVKAWEHFWNRVFFVGEWDLWDTCRNQDTFYSFTRPLWTGIILPCIFCIKIFRTFKSVGENKVKATTFVLEVFFIEKDIHPYWTIDLQNTVLR